MVTITLRLTVIKDDGTNEVSKWTFDALSAKKFKLYSRKTGTAGSLALRRQPIARQFGWKIQMRAGHLTDPIEDAMFDRMMDAKKIEWLREVGGKEQWVEFAMDVEQKIEYEFLNNNDRLHRLTFDLVQQQPVWFTDFLNAEVNFSDSP